MEVCLQLLQYCYITVLCIHGQTAVLLVQVRGKMEVLPAVTAVLLHHSFVDTWTGCRVVSTGLRGMADVPALTAVMLIHSAMDTGTECNVECTGYRGNGGSACSYCSTITSLCNGYMDRMQFC